MQEAAVSFTKRPGATTEPNRQLIAPDEVNPKPRTITVIPPRTGPV